jgi:hypothetical protein
MAVFSFLVLFKITTVTPWYTEAAGVAKKLNTPTTPKYVYGIQVANNLLYKFIKIVPIQ